MKSVEDVLVFQGLADDREELHQPGVDDGVERATGNRPVVHQRVFALFDTDSGRLAICRSDDGAGRIDLQPFGLRIGRLERVGDVVGDVVAADADDAGGDHIAVAVEGIAGRTAAEVDDQRTVLLLVVLQHGVGGAGDGEEGFANLQMGGFGRRARIHDAVAVGVDLERVELQHAAGHAQGSGNAAAIVKDIVLVDDIQKFAVFGQGHRARGVQDGVHVLVADARFLHLDGTEE